MNSGLSNRMVGDVNKCFLDLYSRFEKGENSIRVDRNQSGDNGEFSVWNYGTMGFARIRESLVAEDLICKDQEKISGEGKTKTRMLIRPTPEGFRVYRNGGRQIAVRYPMDGPPREISVGVGPLYTNIHSLRDFYETVIEQSGRRAPKYRRETWEHEFYQMIPGLAGKLHGEAEVEVRKWITERLQECRMKATIGAPRYYRVQGLDESLERWMGSPK